MSSEQRDPADVIAEALSRLRGRRPRHPIESAPGEGDRISALHDHPHHRRPGGRGRLGGHPHLPPGPHLGGPAWMRLLDALAQASAPLTVSELGTAVGVDQPRASRLVQQAVERGLVVREADPADARRTRIALSDQGKSMARGMRGQRREALAHALETFTEAERADLARLLTKLADNWRP